MKKILVYGAGRQGIALAFALEALGHKVYIYDISDVAIAQASYKIRGLNPYTEIYFTVNGVAPVADMDAVVSTATYTANLEIAKQCINAGVPYFDLGGNIAVSEKIQAYAQEANKSPVFTDLGLAPGLVNIMAENLYCEMQNNFEEPLEIGMAVGGLPVLECITNDTQDWAHYLKYSIVFSIEGLLNEYFDDCKILQGGEIFEVPGMSHVGPIIFRRREQFEIFNTSGGIAHSLERFKEVGIQNCVYKTIRYPGHRDLILNLKSLYKNQPLELRSKLEELCPPVEQDRVIIIITVNGETLTMTKELEIKCDENWTAMQKATAFPTAAIVHQYLEKCMYDDSGPILSYEDIFYRNMSETLETLGVEI